MTESKNNFHAVIRIMIEKCRDRNMSLYYVFHTYANALDCVIIGSCTWDTMEQMGFPVHYPACGESAQIT